MLRRLFIRSFWLGVVFVFLAVLWSLWFVSHHGFTKKWRRMVVDEAAKHGVYMDVQRLTLSPSKGLAMTPL